MKHKNNKTKFKYKYKPKYGGANSPGSNSKGVSAGAVGNSTSGGPSGSGAVNSIGGPSANNGAVNSSGGPSANNTRTLAQRQTQRNPDRFFNQAYDYDPNSERVRYVPSNTSPQPSPAAEVNKPSGPLEVKIKKPGFFSMDTLLSIPGKIQSALIFIVLICFLISLFMIYMLFTAIFFVINSAIIAFNKGMKDFIKKLPFGIGKKMKAPTIKTIPPNLFELIFG